MQRILFLFLRWALLLSSFEVHCAAAIRSSDVYARPQISLPKVSPDGRQLCLVANNGKIDVITLLDLVSFQPRTVGDLNGTRLLNYWWKGTDLLLLLVADETTGFADFRSLEIANKKVGELYRLNRHTNGIKHPLLHDDSHFLVSSYQTTGYDLKKVNVRTGKVEVLEKNPGHVEDWLIRRDGTPLAAVGSEEKVEGPGMVRRSFLLRRTPDGGRWERVELGRQGEPRLVPVSVHPDQRRLLAWDFRPETTASVVALDPATMETEVLFNSPEVNPSHLLAWGDDEHYPRAIGYETDLPRRVYLEDDARQLQAAIDAKLPGTINYVVSHSLDLQVMVVEAESDREAGSYFLFDRRTGNLMPIGPRYAGFPAAEMGSSQQFKFTSRDGLPLTGRIWLPADAGAQVKPPLIVTTPEWINGERTSSSFSRLNQALVSAGYAVAQIDWRGTVGFGRKFSETGDFQIESGLPNDLEDGVRWLLAQGQVDARNVVLYTRWAGGLPAIHSLKTRNLFTAWINFNTRLESWRFDYEALAPSRLDERDVIKARGSRKDVAAYKKSIDVMPLLPKIHLPQFHYYPSPGASEFSLVRKAAKSSGAPATFRHRPKNDPDVAPEIAAGKTLDDILAFLRQHAPPGAR